MKRQRGRNRTGGGGGGGQQTGGGKPGQNANRAFDSNGPDNVKVRGHAQHVCEKYQQLARDAASAGDPVLAENYLQHGEHYFRTLRVLQPNRPVTDIVNRDSYTTGFDLDFEDAAVESAMEQADAGAAAGEAQAQTFDTDGDSRQERTNFDRSPAQRQNGDRQDRSSQDRSNQDRANFDRSNADRSNAERQGQDRSPDRTGAERQNGERPYNDRQARDFAGDRQNSDRQSSDRQPSDRQNGERQTYERPTTERPAFDRNANDRQNGERQNGDRARYEGRQDRDRSRDRPNEERAASDTANGDARRSRERAERVDVAPAPTITPQAVTPVATAIELDAAPLLRSVDGGVSQAPAFLSATPSSGDEAERRPRARRTRRPRDGDDAAPIQPKTEDA